jgi:hypothetical protein
MFQFRDTDGRDNDLRLTVLFLKLGEQFTNGLGFTFSSDQHTGVED